MFFDKNKYLYLLDFKNIAYICFWAAKSDFPHDITEENFNQFTSGVVDRTMQFLNLAIDPDVIFRIDNVIACNDVPSKYSKNFRKGIYQDYKSNRKPPDEWFIKSLPVITKLFDALKIPVVSDPEYEADDLIGSYACFYKEQNKDNIAVIVSGDKDFFQLVDAQVYFKRIRKKDFELYTNADDVYEKMNVYPHQFVDYLAITGDNADCIPGAKGVGPKGAEKCLQFCDNIENLKKSYTNTPLLKGVQEKLSKSWSSIDVSRELAKIVTDIDIDTSLIQPEQTFNLDPHFNQDLNIFLKKCDLL